MTGTTKSRLSRTQLYAVLFILLGLFLITFARLRIDADGMSILGFEKLGRQKVPTRLTVTVLGASCALSALIGFVCVRNARTATVALVVSMALAMVAILTALAQGASIDLVGMLASSLRMCTPIALGAAAGILCERAGVVNIAIEGMMLAAAAFGFGANLFFENIWVGVLAAVLVGGLMAGLHAVMSIRFKTDQIISGTAINILAVGTSGFLRRAYLVNAYFVGQTLPIIRIPLLADIPVLGTLFFRSQPMVYTMMILVPLLYVVLFHTPWGLRTRAVGEHPRAADTVGINVFKMRYVNVIVAGCIAGLAGAWFSLETVGSFEDMMTGGKGFIALAAMIFGNWNPIGAFLGALLFGFADALQIKLQILNVPLPYQFLGMAPYVATMIVVGGVIGRSTPPAAEGKAYEK
ncbi:MAG TPA: ABC transporter permease [Anaerolineae bacterium]|nr:ABC transporter permease [Anaerolineae bacterium]